MPFRATPSIGSQDERLAAVNGFGGAVWHQVRILIRGNDEKHEKHEEDPRSTASRRRSPSSSRRRARRIVAPSLRSAIVLRAQIVSHGSSNYHERAYGEPHGDELTATMFHCTDSTPTSNDGVVPSTRAHSQHVSEVAVDPRV
jgi:hypothetical protein